MNAAIIGSGQTEHRSRRLDVNAPELIDEAVQHALADAGLGPDGVEAIVVGNMEHFEGIHLSDLWAVEGAGGVGKPQLKVATGGTTSVTGSSGIASRSTDVVSPESPTKMRPRSTKRSPASFSARHDWTCRASTRPSASETPTVSVVSLYWWRQMLSARYFT